MDLRSDGPHPSNFSLAHPQRDFRSHRPHPENDSQVAQDAQKDFPRIVSMSCDRINRRKENSVVANQSDDDDGYDTDSRNFLAKISVICKLFCYGQNGRIYL